MHTEVPGPPTDPEGHRPTAARPGRPPFPRGPESPPENLAGRVPIPRLHTHLLTGPYRVRPADAQERGAAGAPALRGRGRTRLPHPQLQRRRTRKSDLLVPTHLACGPVFGRGSSDVRAAATWSPRLPQLNPAAGRAAATANRACACGRGRGGGGGRGRVLRAPAPRGSTAAEGPSRPRAAPPPPAGCGVRPAPGMAREAFLAIHPKTLPSRKAPAACKQ